MVSPGRKYTRYTMAPNRIFPDWTPGKSWWEVKDGDRETVAMFRDQALAEAYAASLPAAALWGVAIAVCEAAYDWVTDDGTCHFCAYHHETQPRHDDDCPLKPFEGGAMQTLLDFRKIDQT